MNTPDTRASWSYTDISSGDEISADGHHDNFHVVLGVKTSNTDGLEPGSADVCLDLATVIALHRALGEHIACAALTMQELQNADEEDKPCPACKDAHCDNPDRHSNTVGFMNGTCPVCNQSRCTLCGDLR